MMIFKRILTVIIIAIYSLVILGCSNQEEMRQEKKKYLDSLESYVIISQMYQTVVDLKAPSKLKFTPEELQEEKIIKQYAQAMIAYNKGDKELYKQIIMSIPNDYNGRLASSIKLSKNSISKITNHKNNINKTSIFDKPLANYGDYENYRISNNVYIEFNMSGKHYTFSTLGGKNKKVYILDDNAWDMMRQGLIDDYDLAQITMIGAIYKFDDFYHCVFVTDDVPRLLICNPVDRTFKFYNGLKKNGSYESVESHSFIKLLSSR